MPLVTCPDCKKQMSDAARTCPHCGKPAEWAERSDRFQAMIKADIKAQKKREDMLNPFKKIGFLFGGKDSD